MARLPVPPQTGPADTSGTKDAGETPLEPSSRSKKNGTSGGPSYSTNGARSTNVITLPESNICENVHGENTQRRKSRQRGNENSGESVSESSAGHEACGSLSGENNVNRNSSTSSSKTNECNGRTLNRNKRGNCQSSSKRVGRSSGSSSSMTVDTTEYVPRESGGESSSDDEGDEIDLRAKTAEELGRQGEHFEDSEDTESSEVDECAVQASFGLFDPHERDEEAICCLLRQSVLRSNLKFSPSALQQVAAAVAHQGNVGSVLKTIDDEAAEEGEELQQKAQECGSGSTSSSAVESTNSSKHGASPSSTTAIAACGRQAGSPRDSVRGDTHETEERQEGESGTVVGFLTLLSFQQYPEVVAPFKKAVRELASEHASAEQKRTLERIFVTSVPDTEDRIVSSRISSTSANKAGTTRNNPAAQLRELGDGVKNCGWLLKERLSNTPPQLLPQMYDSLLEDISWSLATKEMDEAERPFYAYSHVCGLTKVYKAGDGRSHSGTFKRHRTGEALPFDAVFPHPEDELLIRFSSLSFTWPTGHSVRISLENDGMEPSSAAVPAGCEQTCLATRIRCCPEYLVFFALPFEQFRRCKDAIAARAREVNE